MFIIIEQSTVFEGNLLRFKYSIQVVSLRIKDIC